MDPPPVAAEPAPIPENSAETTSAVPPPAAVGCNNKRNDVIKLDVSKAGMARVDKSRVEAIINESSKGSPFYANEQRKAAARSKRILEMQQKGAQFDAMTPLVQANIHRQVSAMEHAMETSRSFGVYVSLDMDMFFAAVEEKKNPSLRNVPFGVGGLGMLSTSNYLAREYGVRAGMPGYIAKKLCPELIFVHSSYDVYRVEAEAVREIVREYDPHFVSGGLDELTMELTPYLTTSQLTKLEQEDKDGGDGGCTHHHRSLRELFAAAAVVVEEIRARIAATTQLTASCGIAATPCLAKIVSNYNKPNGQFVLTDSVTREGIMTFMRTLPVRRVPGVGKVMEEVLDEAFHIRTCGDLFDQRVKLFHCMTRKTYEFLLAVALGTMGWGFDGSEDDDGTGDAHRGGSSKKPSSVGADSHIQTAAEDANSLRNRKSIGHERTFRAVQFPHELIVIAERNLTSAHQTLVEENLFAGQVGLKLKYKSFEVRNVTAHVKHPTQDLEVLRLAMMTILEPFLSECSHFRLLGVRLCELSVEPPDNDGNTSSTAPHGSEGSGSPLKRKQQAQQQPKVTLDALFARHHHRAAEELKSPIFVSPSSSSCTNLVYHVLDDEDDDAMLRSDSVVELCGRDDEPEADDIVIIDHKQQQHQQCINQKKGSGFHPLKRREDPVVEIISSLDDEEEAV